MDGKAWRGVLAAALAALSAYTRQLLAPLFVLALVMALDYATGVAAAWAEQNLSSRVGWKGIIKKASYLAIVAVGMVLDYIVAAAGAQLGMELPLSFFFGLLVTVWLILNECISILENARALGLPVPEFLSGVLQRLKKKSEESVAPEEEER